MFTYEISEDVGKVRLLISDTNPNDYHFTDEDITGLLGLQDGDVFMAAALALESWAAFLAASASDVQLGDYRQMDYHKAREMRLAAERMRATASEVPAFAISEKAWGGAASFEGRIVILNQLLRGEL